MLEPSKVKEAFNKVKGENYDFITYLKNHADSDELDKQFFELHNKLFKEYDCSKCRNCCKEYSGTFEEEAETELAASLLKMTKKEFMNKYIENINGEYIAKGDPCCFLSKNSLCSIEKCKPEGCRDFPFTNKPDRLFSLYSIIEFTSVCPVVFEMMERLKNIYGFRRKRY